MKDTRLTSRQGEILGFLKDFIMENGYPPSLRDICGRFNIKGPQNAGKHLAALEKKGFIKRSSNISRGIEVAGPAGGGRVATLPIAGRVRAGAPCLAVEDIVGYVALDEGFFRCRDAFVLKVEGNSMIGAGIEDGDHIVVRPQSGAMDGDIVVALIDDAEATVKRFSRKGRRIILKPENPAMEPMELDGKRPVSIIGKVASVIKRFER